MEKLTTTDDNLEQKNEIREQDIPLRKRLALYTLCALVGIVGNLPRSYFITAVDYWMYKFRNTTSENSSAEHRNEMQSLFISVLSTVNDVLRITIYFGVLFYGNKINIRIRLIGTLSLVIGLFVLITIFTEINTDDWQMGFFVISIILISLVNGLSSIFNMSGIAMISQFPPNCFKIYLVGQEWATIIIATLRIISLATGLFVVTNTLIYFLIGVFILTLCLGLILFVERDKLFASQLQQYVEGQARATISWKESGQILKATWAMAISVIFLLGTLIIYQPNITSLVVSEDEGNGNAWNDTYFVPFVSFFLISFCMMIGKFIGIVLTKTPQTWVFLVVNVVRACILVPLVMLCNAQPRHHLPVVFPHDYQYIIIVIIYGLTNGYMFCAIIVKAQEVLPKELLQTTFTEMMVLFEIIQVGMGFIGIAFVKLFFPTTTPRKMVKDKFFYVFIVFFVLGLVQVLPMTYFSTAIKYWMYKFRNTTSDTYDSSARTDLQAEFFSALSITSYVTKLTCLIFTTLFEYKSSLKWRVNGSLSLMSALFIVCIAFVQIDTDSWQLEFFYISLLIVAVTNAANAVLGISLITILSNFPHIYLKTYLTGEGVASIFSALLQIISLSIGFTLEGSAIIYFSLGFLMVFSSLILFIGANFNEFSKFYLGKHQVYRRKKLPLPKNLLGIFRKIWSPILSTILLMLSSSPVHMSVTSLVASEYERVNEWGDTYFSPVASFLLYSISDVIGRCISNILPKNFDGIYLVLLAFARLIFVPLIIFCNAQPRKHLSVYFPHDYQYMIIIAIYSIIGGYIMNMTMLNVRKHVQTNELKDAYAIMVTLMAVLMAAFSFLGMITVKIL